MYAAAIIDAKGEINHMSVVSQPVSEQAAMWQRLWPPCKVNLFQVQELAALQALVPLQHVSNRHYVGCVCEAEAGHPEQLIAQIPEWQHGCPQLVIVMPAPYTTLNTEKVWAHCVLFRRSPARFGQGQSFMKTRWDLLGVGWADLPDAPAVSDQVQGDVSLSLGTVGPPHCGPTADGSQAFGSNRRI